MERGVTGRKENGKQKGQGGRKKGGEKQRKEGRKEGKAGEHTERKRYPLQGYKKGRNKSSLLFCSEYKLFPE